jgi:hypothetical protein
MRKLQMVSIFFRKGKGPGLCIKVMHTAIFIEILLQMVSITVWNSNGMKQQAVVSAHQVTAITFPLDYPLGMKRK